METNLVKIETTDKLEEIVKGSGLAIEEGEQVKMSYQPFLNEIAVIQEQSNKINYENPSDIDERIARELRLKTVKIRTGAKDFKDERKKTYLVKGNLEQAAYNLIEATCKVAEDVFNNVEKAKEIKERKFKEERRIERVKILTALDFDFTYTDLMGMPDDQFNVLVNSLENEKIAKAEREKKEKEEAEAKIKAEAAEKERMRIENEKLKKENEEKERKIQIEKAKAAEEQRKQDLLMEAQRKEAAKKLEIEKAKAKKLQDELMAKEEAELKEKARIEAERKAKELEAKKAAKAPDKLKLKRFMEGFTYTDVNGLGEDAGQIKHEIERKFMAFCKWANELIETL